MVTLSEAKDPSAYALGFEILRPPKADSENLFNLGHSAMEMDERAGAFSFDFRGS
jgi:hypothetical protein